MLYVYEYIQYDSDSESDSDSDSGTMGTEIESVTMEYAKTKNISFRKAFKHIAKNTKQFKPK